MTVYVVRHADALSRKRWPDDDALRPLSARGHAQAAGLWEALTPTEVRRIFSSPAVRCVSTVEPISAAAACPLETRDHLMEGYEGPATVELLRELLAADGDSVVCAHGDQLPGVIHEVAVSYGIRLPDSAQAKKGSTWVLALDDGGNLHHPRYVDPPG